MYVLSLPLSAYSLSVMFLAYSFSPWLLPIFVLVFEFQLRIELLTIMLFVHRITFTADICYNLDFICLICNLPGRR